MSTNTGERITTATIEADPDLPIIRITRDFHATTEQLFRAHTDPDLFMKWVGPNDIGTEIDYETTRLSSKFVFNNPNQTDACGCGESFTV